MDLAGASRSEMRSPLVLITLSIGRSLTALSVVAESFPVDPEQHTRPIMTTTISVISTNLFFISNLVSRPVDFGGAKYALLFE